MRGRVHIALSAVLAVLALVGVALVVAVGGGSAGPAGPVVEAVVLPQAESLPSDLPFLDEPSLIDPADIAYVDLAPQPTAVPSVAGVPAAPVAVQTAPAATGPVRGDSTVVQRGTAQVRGVAALDSLPFPWRELGVTISFRDYRGGYLGLYDPSSKHVTIYVKRTQSAQGLRVTIAHELGHALDDKVNTTALRRAYLTQRGVSPRTSWLPCLSCSDYASGAGDFAEVFALATAGRGDFRSRLAGEPTGAQLAGLRAFFRPPSERDPVPVVAAVTAQPAPAPTRTMPRPSPGLVAPNPTPTPSKRPCGVVGALFGCRS